MTYQIHAVPQNANSVAKTAFLAWFLRKCAAFVMPSTMDSIPKALRTLFWRRDSALSLSPALENPSPSISPFVSLLINVVFFGIPKTYLAYLRQSFKYKGRLNNMHQNWGDYISKLVREYSTFLLIVNILFFAYRHSLTVVFCQVNCIAFVRPLSISHPHQRT